MWVKQASQAQFVCRTLNSSLKSLLSSAMRRFISSSSFSTGSGGYFLFVLGRRANSGTVWNSVPARRKGGGRRGGKEQEGRGETGGDRGTGRKGVGKWELDLHLVLTPSCLFSTMATRGRCDSTLWHVSQVTAACWLGNHPEQKPSTNS